MKGLLWKDAALLKSQKRFMLLVVFMMAAMSLGGVDAGFLMSYVPFVFCILVMSSISYDEIDNSLPFLVVLPVSRRDYVKEKYLFGIALGFGGLLLSFLAVLLYGVFRGQTADIMKWVIQMLLTAGFIVAFISLMIPIQIKFGSEKGRVYLMVAFFAVVGLIYVFSSYEIFPAQTVLRVFRFFAGLPVGVLGAAGVLAAAAVLGGSYRISVGIMEKKEL